MVTVKTKKELKSAIEKKQFPIRCTGQIASRLTKRKRIAKKAKIGGALLALGGLAAIPFTGGASAVGTAAGMTAMGLTLSGGAATAAGLTVAITTAELAILVGGGVAIIAILKGRRVKLEKDGTVTIE